MSLFAIELLLRTLIEDARWEYRNFDVADDGTEYLNEMGSVGWEIITGVYHHNAWHYLMKRRITR